MNRQNLILVLLLSVFSMVGVVTARQTTPLYQCLTRSGYGVEINPRHYVLDFQCQPSLDRTVEIPVGQSITVTVNLSNYYTATGLNRAEFLIHLAMDRARLFLRQSDALEGTEITDFTAALQDVPINTQADTYTFVIENRGLRSAVFDLSLRPSRS